MATTQELINALVANGYNPTDAANAARGTNAGNLAKEYLGTTVSSDIPASTVTPGSVSAAPLPAAPAGGYQQGGWYGGRQFWNGTFSQPGQIHPESNQTGAGTMVSPEILASTSKAAGLQPGANQAYINAQYAGVNAPAAGATPIEGVYAGKVTTPGGTAGAVAVELTPSQVKANEIQTRINEKKAEADKRRGEVNNNPFLSEASRVGQIAKIDNLLNDAIATDNTNLLYYQKQADAEKLAATPDYSITTETDKAGNVTIITVDKKTGKLVSKVSAGAIGKATTPKEPTSAETREQNMNYIRTGLLGSVNSYGHVSPEIWNAALRAFVEDGLGTYQEFLTIYGYLKDPNRTDEGTVTGYYVQE